MPGTAGDVFKMKADDGLAAERQVEIAQVIAVLKRFQPTKIAVEADVYSERVPKTYTDYLAGKYELTRNEIEQLISIRKLGQSTAAASVPGCTSAETVSFVPGTSYTRVICQRGVRASSSNGATSSRPS